MKSESERAREIALRYIEYQPRTTEEVRRRLARGGVEESAAESVIGDLTRAGLLDDSRFSAEWVESRSRRKGLGRIRLASELRRRGIGAEAAAEALTDLTAESELEAACAAAIKRLGAENPGDPAVRRRLAGFLQRRGYGWETIEQVFSRLASNSP